MKLMYNMLIGVTALLLTACVGEEKDLFSKSAAQRLTDEMENTRTLLVDASNGWLMEYYATETSGGYSMLIDFEGNGTTTVSSYNSYFPELSTVSSEFEIIGDNAAVLTFNTFNSVMHYFSIPENPAGLGLQGDYEFVVMDLQDELISLRGKKRWTQIYLRKLSENQDHKKLLNDLYDTDRFAFSSQVPYQYLNVGDERFRLYNGASHVFQLTLDVDDYDSNEGETIPFIVTEDGFKTYPGKKIRECDVFKFNADKTKLIAEGNENVTITGMEIDKIFSDSSCWVKGWKIDFDNMGGVFNEYYASILDVYNDFGEIVLSTTKKIKGKPEYAFSFVGGDYIRPNGFRGKYVGYNAITFKVENSDDGTITVRFADKAIADDNGNLYRKTVKGFDEFINALCGGQFVISAASPLRPTVLKLTSVINQDNWFFIELNNSRNSLFAN